MVHQYYAVVSQEKLGRKNGWFKAKVGTKLRSEEASKKVHFNSSKAGGHSGEVSIWMGH